MSLNYAIFRSGPIYNLSTLGQIGSHNRRKKKIYKSNPDINLNLSHNNIEIVPLDKKYVKKFYELTKDYKKQHNERMKNERKDRKRAYYQMLNESKNVVADELIFTATNEFFKNMTIEDIKEWANTCMEFVYDDLGYTKEQVLHAVIHMDEKTPHIHCVVIPLVKKFDKRTNTDRYTISKKQYIKNKRHLSILQDKFYARLVSKGYDLKRGIKGSNKKHIPFQEYKRNNKNYNNYSNKYDLIKNDNIRYKREIKLLKLKIIKLEKEKLKLKKAILIIINSLKIFFRNVLQLNIEIINNLVVKEIKNIFFHNQFTIQDIYNISRGTSKESELFEYAQISNYHKKYKDNENMK